MRRSGGISLFLALSGPALASDFTGLYYAFLTVFGAFGLVCALVAGAIFGAVLREGGRKVRWTALWVSSPLGVVLGLLLTQVIDPNSFTAMGAITGLTSAAVSIAGVGLASEELS